MPYYQGAIILAKVYFSDLSDFKVRPVLIISKNSMNGGEDLIVLKLTTQITGHASTIQISNNDVSFNLDRRSEIRCQDVFKIHKDFVIKSLGHVNESILDKTLEKVRQNFLKE